MILSNLTNNYINNQFILRIMEYETIDLKDKIAFVTGASSGIGLEITKSLAKEGCVVIMVARDYDKLKRASKEIGSKVFPFSADVSDYSQIKDVVKKTLSEFNRIDILVNNAGMYEQQYIKELDMERFDKMIKTNLFGTAICTSLILPHMLKQDNGTIINISSGLGRHGSPGNSAYCASKFGLMGFTECLEMELKDSNINVSTILPGQTNTPLFDGLKDEKYKKKMLNTRYIADAVIYLCKLPPDVKVKELSVRPNI